ncbi:hypothetical protein [Spirosoma gilvum]
MVKPRRTYDEDRSKQELLAFLFNDEKVETVATPPVRPLNMAPTFLSR